MRLVPYACPTTRCTFRLPRFVYSLVFPLVAALLAGCAGPAAQSGNETSAFPPRSAVTDFSLEARFSVTSDGERHSGRLSWRHGADRDELRLSSPFGQVIAEILVDRQKAQLVTSDRRVFEAPDAQQLTREVLGYSLPISQLSDWVLGRQREGDRVELDALKRPLRMEAGSWQIDYEYDQAVADAVPGLLLINRPGGPELRLRIEEWRAP